MSRDHGVVAVQVQPRVATVQMVDATNSRHAEEEKEEGVKREWRLSEL
jgi:hypothetical protein